MTGSLKIVLSSDAMIGSRFAILSYISLPGAIHLHIFADTVEVGQELSEERERVLVNINRLVKWLERESLVVRERGYP